MQTRYEIEMLVLLEGGFLPKQMKPSKTINLCLPVIIVSQITVCKVEAILQQTILEKERVCVSPLK